MTRKARGETPTVKRGVASHAWSSAIVSGLGHSRVQVLEVERTVQYHSESQRSRSAELVLSARTTIAANGVSTYVSRLRHAFTATVY